MALSAARRILLSSAAARTGAAFAVAAFLLAAANVSLQSAVAEGDTRTLSFHHLHTGEDITITFKRNGRYDPAALKKLDWFMRDWRKEQDTRMDPHLFDLLWEVYREVGATAPIQVVCGYRSPATNAMLRRRSSGVAELSEHTLGHAMDFYIPGVPLEKLREVGLRLQEGGVGFYPSSGSPFVHMDVGNIRHWPRMTYAQLSRVFPDGRTVHVAADGRPLPGFSRALAEVERRGKTPNMLSLRQARAHGAINDAQERMAEGVARHEKRTLLARIFGGNESTETADEADAATPAAPAKAAAVQVASAEPRPVPTQRIVPLPTARPMVAAAAASAPYATAALSAKLFDARGLWETAPKPLAALTAAADKRQPVEVAAAEPVTTGSTGTQALAYAPEAAPAAPPQPKAMGVGVTQAIAHGAAVPALDPRNTTVVAKTVPTQAAATAASPRMTSGAQRLDSPWLRAAMLTPSVSRALTATRFGGFDPRGFAMFMHKPARAVAMAFSADPSGGMRTDRFGGSAVTFVATATFVHARTASLD